MPNKTTTRLFMTLCGLTLGACATAPKTVMSTDRTQLRMEPPAGYGDPPPGKSIPAGVELVIMESRLDDRMEEGVYWLLLVRAPDGTVGWIVADESDPTATTPDDIVFNVQMIHRLPYEWVCDQAEMIRTGDAGYWFASGRRSDALSAKARLIGADGYWAAASMYRDLSSYRATELFTRAENLLGPVKVDDLDTELRKRFRKTAAELRDRARHDSVTQCADSYLPLLLV